MGFGIWDLGLGDIRCRGLGFRVEGLGVWDLGLRVGRYRVWGWKF